MRRGLPRPLLTRLVVSRLARDRTTGIAFVAAATAFGAIGYGLYFRTSVDDAVADKVVVRAGARSVHELDTARLLARMPGLAARSTPVWRQLVSVDGAGSTPLMVLDPETFARGALWSDRLADGRRLADVLEPLRGASATQPLPVLVVGEGDDVPATGTATRQLGWSSRYEVVDRLAAFPGLGEDQTLMVTTSRALFARIGAESPIRRPASAEDPDRAFSTELWSALPADRVAALARDAGVFVELESTADQVRAGPVLLARAWVTDDLQLCTGLALALGLLVLAGLHRRGAEQRRLQDSVLADLGYGRTLVARSAGVEIGVVAALGALAGGSAAYAVTVSLRSRLDPLPDLAPALGVTGTGTTVLTGLAFVVAAVLLAASVTRPGGTASINELLHDE